MKPTYLFVCLLWSTGIFGVIAQNNRQLIVQFDTEVAMKPVFKDLAAKKTMGYTLLPVKRLSETLNIWLMEVDTAWAGIDRNSNVGSFT